MVLFKTVGGGRSFTGPGEDLGLGRNSDGFDGREPEAVGVEISLSLVLL